MKKKKKPNFLLRRIIARLIIIIFVILISILIFKNQLVKIPLYIHNSEYKELIDSFFKNEYTVKETKQIIEELKKEDKISKVDTNMISGLHNKGYKNSTINFVILNMSKTQIRKLLNKEYDEDLEGYLSISLFNYDNYNRYIEYQEYNDDLSLEDIVIRVELNLDLDPYEESELIDDPNSYTTLVNKHRYLSKNYEPDDLVEMDDEYSNNDYGTNKLRKEAYEYFKMMVDDASDDGINFYAETAYRSFEDQDDIYYEYLYMNGSELTNKYAAKAGYSEHQLGTAIDLANVWNIEEGDKEHRWIEKFGYRYGFIFRYNKADEDITGYAAEGWHIRYVGIEAATIIHKENITFDEYWIKYLKNKDSN